jgi:hypothetical protein
MAARPQNVGVLAMEVYFPASFVRQVSNRTLSDGGIGRCVACGLVVVEAERFISLRLGL